MLLHRLSRSTLQAVLFGAAAVGAVALMPAPEAKAACLPTDPSNTCTTFDPTTPSNPTGVTGFDGSLTVATGQQLNRFRVNFYIAGYVGAGFDITNIAVTGNGITTSLSVPFVSVAANGLGSPFVSSYVNLNTSLTTGSTLNFAQSSISFTIPAGLNQGSSITAELFYASTAETGGVPANSITSGNDFTTTAASAPVPAPLPLLGAGAAFGFSRKIRRRISRAS
jgi:hypothetical protein